MFYVVVLVAGCSFGYHSIPLNHGWFHCSLFTLCCGRELLPLYSSMLVGKGSNGNLHKRPYFSIAYHAIYRIDLFSSSLNIVLHTLLLVVLVFTMNSLSFRLFTHSFIHICGVRRRMRRKTSRRISITKHQKPTQCGEIWCLSRFNGNNSGVAESRSYTCKLFVKRKYLTWYYFM